MNNTDSILKEQCCICGFVKANILQIHHLTICCECEHTIVLTPVFSSDYEEIMNKMKETSFENMLL